MKIIFPIISCVFLLGCSEFPHDQANTMKRVRDGELKVGVIENPPWTNVEKALVEEFAKTMNAKLDFYSGSESNHMEALRTRQLDVVIGGLTKKTPWTGIGKSLPFYRAKFFVADKPGSNRVEDLSGTEVMVKSGTPEVALLRGEGANVVTQDHWENPDLPVAIYDYEAAARGLVARSPVLKTEEHIIATAPGENRFLRTLDKFIIQFRSSVAERLKHEVRP